MFGGLKKLLGVEQARPQQQIQPRVQQVQQPQAQLRVGQTPRFDGANAQATINPQGRSFYEEDELDPTQTIQPVNPNGGQTSLNGTLQQGNSPYEQLRKILGY